MPPSDRGAVPGVPPRHLPATPDRARRKEARMSMDILRTSVTPRATEISDRIDAALRGLPYVDIDRATVERRSQLREWQFVIVTTIAWGMDLDAAEYGAWLERLGG
jgi:hypothetical protein